MIRRATPGDVAALRAIASAAYRKYVPRIGRPPAPMTADYADPVSAGLALAEEHARGLGLAEVRLYTNEAMTENIAYYTRHGYGETHRQEQDGFRRVFFRKPVP